MANIQVTHDSNINNARSESAVLVNPNNPQQIVAASKKFNNLHTYDFTLASSYSTDGGLTWQDSTPFVLTNGATVMTDPTLAWDDAGGVYMLGLIGTDPPTFDTIGMVVYKSTDGGKTWGAAKLIHQSTGDDKQWMAGDANPASPHHGNLYAAWDDGLLMRFARSLDRGATWIGVGGQSIADTNLTNDSFSPEVNISANGNVFIVWLAKNTIKLLVSKDGGDSFQLATSPATGIQISGAILHAAGGWPAFPGGNFRFAATATACIFGDMVVAAWDDFREGPCRIYFALSTDAGTTWTTGASGQPLISGSVSSGLQHFFPQLIVDPNGVIGCAFYEFGPKPVTPLIDVKMAQSFDGGQSFLNFTVTDQPWDPAINAPWTHHSPDTGTVDASVTFIGDYFGIDASTRGFYPLWTDTRTGMQELFVAIAPERRCTFLVERSTLGQDEVDARRKLGQLPIKDAFRVVVDGFTAAQLGVSGASSKLAVASPVGGMTITCTGNVADTGGYGADVQRFTFNYDIGFDTSDSAFGFAAASLTVNLQASVPGITAAAQIELIKQPNPFILHGDPYWLSIDLRVFAVRVDGTKFGVNPLAGAADAPRFIQDIIKALNNGQGTAGGQSFSDTNVLPTDETGSALFLQPSDLQNKPVFNFALAKVHYIGTIGATAVRTFFRLFQAQNASTAFDYPPGADYRRTLSNPHGQPIALAGIRGTEYVTVPCFASTRIDTTASSMAQQTDDPNVQNLVAHGDGSEVDAYFGCWLDLNQPFKPGTTTPNNVLPAHVPAGQPDGPFTDPANPPQTIQQSITRNLHQCLVAEIAFDPIPIPFGKDPSNWDKLAQRNIAWSDVGSAQAVTTFEIRPSLLDQPAGGTLDEILIDWGNLPADSTAEIYLPAIPAAQVLDLAARRYTTQKLTQVDGHTLGMAAAGLTYIPIPRGGPAKFAGLLTIDVPSVEHHGQAYQVAVRQITDAHGRRTATPARNRRGRTEAAVSVQPILWRRTLGAFGLSIPVGAKHVLLPIEERNLSVLRWIGETIPRGNRWDPVFHRYLDVLGGRVRTFGGDPGLILPSPTGDWHKPPTHGGDHDPLLLTGKVAGLIFDHFGDFDGFILETETAEHVFASRETEIASLAQRAWRERLRISVRAARRESHRPLSIIVRSPPSAFV